MLNTFKCFKCLILTTLENVQHLQFCWNIPKRLNTWNIWNTWTFWSVQVLNISKCWTGSKYYYFFAQSYPKKAVSWFCLLVIVKFGKKSCPENLTREIKGRKEERKKRKVSNQMPEIRRISDIHYSPVFG